MNARPSAASLFSGVGLLDLGLEWAGWDIRWGCEIDPWCRAIWEQRFERPCYADARELPAGAERVDLLAGGFPCQPVSLAGRGLAQADTRWLWPAFERAIRLLRPRFVLVENVLGLANRGLADVLGGLATLGFDAEWTVFGASDVGAPHQRRRLWIVAAHPDDAALWDERGGLFGPGWSDSCLAGHDGAPRAVADTDGEGELQPRGGFGEVRGRTGDRSGAAADSGEVVGRACPVACECQEDPGRELRGHDWWSSERGLGRVAHGQPHRVDRLAALGNGVVPQCAQIVGARVLHLIREGS